MLLPTRAKEAPGHPASRRETYAALPAPGRTSSRSASKFRYVNYLAEDEVGNPVADAYGPNYQRLRALKSKYDPENFFHTNVNITPLHG